MCLAFHRDQKVVLKKAWAFKILGIGYLYAMCLGVYLGYKEISEAMNGDILQKPNDE